MSEFAQPEPVRHVDYPVSSSNDNAPSPAFHDSETASHRQSNATPLDPDASMQLARMYGVPLGNELDGPPGVCVAPAPPPDPKEALLEMNARMNAQTLVMASRCLDSANGKQLFLFTLDRLDEPKLRERTLEQFRQLTGQKLEDFVSKCDLKERDKNAIGDLVSKSRGDAEEALAKLPPEKLKEMQARANEEALQVLAVTRADGSNSDENAQKIFRTLGPRDPMEMELIRRAIRDNTNGDESLYSEVDKHMHGANEDEAVADMSGNPVANTVAGLKNATGDKARASELLRAVKKGNLAEVKAQLGPAAIAKLLGSVDGAERAELEALLDGKAADADAAQLGDMLKDPGEGIGGGTPSKKDLQTLESRQAENVLKAFESKSREEILAAEKAWDEQQALAGAAGYKKRSFSDMIKERFAASDPDTYARIQALLEGNVGKDKALELKKAMADHDQAKIEEALADPDLASEDPKKKAEAQERRKQMEETLRAEDKLTQQALALHRTGQFKSDIQGRSMEEQVKGYYQQLKDDPLKGANVSGGSDGAREAVKLEKAGAHADNDAIGVEELMKQGKFTEATLIHRAREDGDKKQSAEVIDKIKNKKELDADREEYEHKYKEKMFKDPMDTLSPLQKATASQMEPAERDQYIREHMTRNEMLEENVRRYGARGERDIEQEQKLQQELYDRQSSGSLELGETLRGGGTQQWARQELAARQKVIDAGHRDAQGKLHLDAAETEKAKRLDEGASKALATQEEEKIKLGEHLAHVFGTLAKIASLLIGQPELIFLADMATSLTEMAIKASVEGEAYDAGADAKMMAVTAMADAAFVGLSGMAKAKNLEAAQKVDSAEEANATADKLAKTASADEKANVVAEGADRVAGPAPVDLKNEADGAIASDKAATQSADDVREAAEKAKAKKMELEQSTVEEKKAVEAKAELKKANEERDEVREHGGVPAKLAHETITNVGGGVVNGEDASQIMLNVGLAWAGELTGGFDKTIAGKLGGSELAKTGAEFTRKSALSVAGGKSSAEDIANVGLGMAGDKWRDHDVKHYNDGHKAADQKHYTVGEAEAEMAEPKKAEEQEKASKKREEAEAREAYEQWNEATESREHEESK